MDGSIPPNTHADSDELRSARAIRLAYLAAERAGPAVKPLTVLSSEDLEAPIQLSDVGLDPDYEGSTPTIVGYLISKEISRGGQATIYLATQETTGRQVAVKVLQGGGAIPSHHRTRFEREVSALASLQHPNIVGILDRGRTQDRSFFLVMDFVDGCELDQYVKQHVESGTDGTLRLLQLFIKISAAIEEAHKLGIVHRDIKPSNIRIDRRDEPRILDFGLARRPGLDSEETRSMTVPGHIVGSLPWSSPEQLVSADEVTTRSDVYSIGVMLYQAIAGQPPYPIDGTLSQLLDNIARAKPGPPSRVKGARGTGRKRELDAIILKCLAKTPGDRYASAGMLAADLENLLAGRRVVASPRKTSRKMLALAGCLMVAAISGVAWHDLRVSTPRTFQQPTMQNSIGQRMVRVPAGEFVMNDESAEPKGQSEPPTVVKVRSFSISATEVTQAQYSQIIGMNPSASPDRAPASPVQNVSWDDATAFCQRLSEKEHRRYRLPTVSEWEYACEAGTRTPFGAQSMADVGWYAGNSDARLHAVGQKGPNSWGIYDMHGGVAEWCADDPANMIAHDSPSPDLLPRKAVRGGSFLMSADDCRSTSQQALTPSRRRRDLGFRIVLDDAG